MDISTHFEALDHEFNCLDIKLLQAGYKVDGDNGIKIAVGLSTRRSVDYFYILNDKCIFIEFTDICQGQIDLIGIEDCIAKAEKRLHRNKLTKLLKQDQRREMVEKFKDSKDIFFKISDSYNNAPTPLLNNDAKVFYIVHAPIKEDLQPDIKVEIIRFISTLKSSVSNCLEDEICSRVKLMFLDDFIQEVG